MLCPQLRLSVPQRGRVKLSPRQREGATLLGQGMIRKQIAEAMQISEGTVAALLARAKERLGAANSAQLAVMVAKESNG